MTPKTLFIYLDSFKTELKKEYENNYNLQIINAFYTAKFHNKKSVNLKQYLLGENKSKPKKMNENEMLDAIKKCHLAFGGKIEDFKNI